MTLDILCKVVDNFGDIGVVYRLARALSDAPDAPRIRLIVDDLAAFNLLEPAVDPSRAVQSIRGWTLLSWAGPDGSTNGAYEAAYNEDPAIAVIECFACGRPDWLEKMLFDAADGRTKTIVNLEYLTAEPYADEFHRMPSLTRSRAVRKYIFMPGFTAATGGLILDGAFMAALRRYAEPATRTEFRRELTARVGFDADGLEANYWAVVFGYERDYGRVVRDLAEFHRGRPVLAIVASGKSDACFIAAWERAERPFPVCRLPFLRQEAWDEVLCAADFLVVRGEDSMARAALSGKPFLWHAYPQEGAHQMVKVRALLDRMRPHFGADEFSAVEDAFLAFNDRLADGVGVCGEERILPLMRLESGFRSFSAGLMANGNLGFNLMTFLREIV
ncbi:MAG: hypothetical protein CVV47_02260 [Spirochaetae bacterium HGW-Spirochaetae-3]|jgi:uncharacterized repeat protein (TIGR03837 family)|nr:MAG: hypothetical protein CVV47_02260 [Spirochaetae bacterium HGW-Spirochaetae-3]